jgi:phage tail sheath protein FI
MLGGMYATGAFAGSTEGAAFQVVTDEEPGSSSAAVEGRFTVDLRVAPAVPMTFLTVRLLRSGDRSLVTEVR